MTTKHTPEPWRVHNVKPEPGTVQVWTDESHGSMMIATFAGMGKENNARHTVACVNACEGINPPAVPEIVAALQNLLDIVDWLQKSGNMKSPVTPHPFGLGVIGAKQAARTALARAKGEPCGH